MGFAWQTWGSAKAELARRLNDVAFVTPAEAGLYLGLAMRIFQAHTAFWVSEWTTILTPPFSGNWLSANGPGSPRQPSLSDIDLYTLVEYMLLEPPTAGTWTGTSQFSMAALAQAVQGRRDEALQIGATNMAEIVLPIAANISRVTLPDSVLDVRRVRYVPAAGQGAPVVLERGDAERFRTFNSGYLQTNKYPLRWDVISGPPLALTLDTMVPVPATVEILTMQAEAVPAPPSATALGIPDDYSWVPLFGALADVLGSQEESLDVGRAKYAMGRYTEGLEMLRRAPWLLEARINGVAVGVSSVTASDRFNYAWQANTAAFPQIVEAGTDLYAVSPVPTSLTSIELVVVGNAPIPASDATQIQVPRDVMDCLLDEAEHLAQFKRGTSEVTKSMGLHKSFLETVQRWNNRIRAAGPLSTTLRPVVPREEGQQPRFT